MTGKQVLARDLGTGPFRPFGSALIGGDGGHCERPIPITVRPIRPRGINNGRCLACGDRFFGCGHDEEDDQ